MMKPWQYVVAAAIYVVFMVSMLSLAQLIVHGRVLWYG